jgi:choloylglycine hydrolase
MKKCVGLFLIAWLLLGVCHSSHLEACSVFRVIAKDGTIISARTMEFGKNLNYGILVVPRGKSFVSPTPNNRPGLQWKTKYGYVANNIFGSEEIVTDGLNEAGLAFSVLWFENDMSWQKIGLHDNKKALAHVLMGTWILGSFSTVEEVGKALKKVRVFGYPVPEMGMAPPGHFIVYDATGGCIVIEYEHGKHHVYDNKLGLMTNAPNFPWMVTYLRTFVGMSNAMLKPQEFADMKFNPMGHGSGMWGLPGDITPSSRFVRLAVMTKFADPPDNAHKALNLAQHIVNALDIVRGMAVDRAPDETIIASETTQWASFRDLTNRIYYFRTYDNLNLRKIELKRLNLHQRNVKTIPMYGKGEVIIDLTD